MGINVIFGDSNYNLMPKQLETFESYTKILRWARANPVAFLEQFMNIKFTDMQKWVFLNTWNSQVATLVMGRSSGKSYVSAPYMMTKALLYPNFHAYIMAPSGGQSAETFMKLENLAKNNIASAIGVSPFFLENCVAPNAKTSPFAHDKSGYRVSLFNGSTIESLNSVAKNIVGIRSSLNWYDEAGKIDRDFFSLTTPFVVQSNDFKTNASGLDMGLMPSQMPNQIVMSSSAEGIDSYLFDMYKLCFQKMLMGDTNYFVCDISADHSLHPFIDGKPVKPLLKQETIDDAMATNSYRCMREYYNIFDHDSGPNAFIKRATLLKFQETIYPQFENMTGEDKYIISVDPSAKRDDCIASVAQLFRTEEKGLCARIINCQNLIEVLPSGEKAILERPQQMEIIKNMVLAYNKGGTEYSNIERLILDAGAGGGGEFIASLLMNDWTSSYDGNKIIHRGFIDLNDPYMQLRADDYTSNATNLLMFNFKRDKAAAYQAAQDLINMGVIVFPKSLNSKFELEYEEVDEHGNPYIRYETVDKASLDALTQIDLMKEEICAFNKITKDNGTIVFETSVDGKAKGIQDNRSDTLAQIAYVLMQLRAAEALDKEQQNEDFGKIFSSVNHVRSKKNPFNSQKRKNPFSTSGNPFL